MIKAVLTHDITLDLSGESVILHEDDLVEIDLQRGVAYFDGLDVPFEIFTGDYGIIQ